MKSRFKLKKSKLSNKLTSIEPKSEGLLVRVLISFNKVIKQAPPSLYIHINIPSILHKPNLRLTRQVHNQILSRIPFHSQHHPPQQCDTRQQPTKLVPPTHLKNALYPHTAELHLRTLYSIYKPNKSKTPKKNQS